METSYEQVTQHLQQASTNFSDNKLVEACGELEAAAASLEALVDASTAAQGAPKAASATLVLDPAAQELSAAALRSSYVVRRIRPARATALAA